MTLSDTDLVLLSAAAQHPDGLLLPAVSHDGTSRKKIAKRLLTRGLVDEVEVARGPAAWFDGEEARKGMKINPAGLSALGLDDDADPPVQTDASERVASKRPQERMNELVLYRRSDDPAERGYKRILAAPQHPDYAAFFGLQGNPLGYNDLKIIEARRLIEAVTGTRQWVADFEFGYRVDRVVEAALVSAQQARWVKTEEMV